MATLGMCQIAFRHRICWYDRILCRPFLFRFTKRWITLLLLNLMERHQMRIVLSIAWMSLSTTQAGRESVNTIKRCCFILYRLEYLIWKIITDAWKYFQLQHCVISNFFAFCGNFYWKQNQYFCIFGIATNDSLLLRLYLLISDFFKHLETEKGRHWVGKKWHC